MMRNAKVLILDEPTAGLDPRERVRLRTLLAGMAQDRIILVATHVVSDIGACASRSWCIKKVTACARRSFQTACSSSGPHQRWAAWNSASIHGSSARMRPKSACAVCAQEVLCALSKWR